MLAYIHYYVLTKDAVQPEAVCVNETPAVVDGGSSPTETRAGAAAAATGGTAATTIITEVPNDPAIVQLMNE